MFDATDAEAALLTLYDKLLAGNQPILDYVRGCLRQVPDPTDRAKVWRDLAGFYEEIATTLHQLARQELGRG